MAYTKLDSGITESTIWQAPDATLRVWIAMLARADQHGYVGASVPGLAALARVTIEACVAALEMLRAPDEWSRTKDHEGRRIADADGGWVLLNHAKYRIALDADMRRERSRIAMRRLRQERAEEGDRAKQQLAEVNNVDLCSLPLAQAYPEAEALNTKQAIACSRSADAESASDPSQVETKKGPPACPHLEILALWAEVLPALPQHLPSQWRGARADHLRARWRETAIEEKWPDAAAGMAYFRKLFVFVGGSRFLTGQAKPRDGGRPFVVELAWLVNPTNWAKAHEGKYHQEESRP